MFSGQRIMTTFASIRLVYFPLKAYLDLLYRLRSNCILMIKEDNHLCQLYTVYFNKMSIAVVLWKLQCQLDSAQTIVSITQSMQIIMHHAIASQNSNTKHCLWRTVVSGFKINIRKYNNIFAIEIKKNSFAIIALLPHFPK